MDRALGSEHALRLHGLRFASRETERAYQQWRTRTSTPFARIGYIGSTPSWVLLLGAVLVLDPGSAGRAAWAVGGWIALLVVLTAATSRPALQRAVMPLAAAANCLAGFLIVWLLSDVVLTDQVSQIRAGVMTAGLVVVMFFGFAVFRIPPGAAVLAVTPYVLYGSLQLLDAHRDGELSAVEAGALTAGQWIAYLGCLLVCLVAEGVGRRTFCKDQLIERQQEELRTSREAVRRYVPRALFEHLVGGDTAVDAPRRQHVAVLFADLVEFTTLADRVEPEVLTSVANDFMSAMSSVVDEHGGLVSEFAGDGVMALFGAPDDMDVVDQGVCAVRAALAMQARLPSLNEQWQRLGVSAPMQMRVGINTGVLSVGSFGSEGRMTYTAIGLQTNIAARLQAHCPPGDVLLSGSTWQLVRDVVPCEPRGEVVCKGVHYPVPVWSPVPDHVRASLALDAVRQRR